MSNYRTDGTIRNVPGFAIAGANVAVLTQPAVTTTQPGSPLAVLYSAANSNAAVLTSASYSGGLITLVFSTTPAADVVTGSFIGLSGVTPAGYNAVWQVVTVVGNNVTVATPYSFSAPNPGVYVSGGTIATSALPNPLQSDGNGQYFFYAAPATYTVQVYSGALPLNTQVYADQVVVSPGSGTVTSVAMTVPVEFAISGSPIIGSGTLAITKVNESANRVFAGPTSGSPGQPTFRALVAADISGLGAGSVTSVGLAVSVPGYLTAAITGSPVTATGTLSVTITANNQNANLLLAGPTSGGAGATSFRALVAADLPLPTASTLGGIQSFAAVTNQWIKSISTSGVPASTQPAFTDISGVATAAQIPNPTASTIGGIQSYAAVTNQWIKSISTSGVPASTQPAFTDISGVATFAQTPFVQTTVTYSATPVFAALGAASFIITLTGNVTSSTITGSLTGQEITFVIVQDGAGSHTFVFPASFKGQGTIASTINGYNVQNFIYNGTNWLASSAMVSYT